MITNTINKLNDTELLNHLISYCKDIINRYPESVQTPRLRFILRSIRIARIKGGELHE